MAIIHITNFGGVMPALSARALPENGAQTNANLFLATTEFRPLKDASTVATGVTSGSKTLHRIDAVSAWTATTEERSYVRGQINGDTTKRTFYSTDSSGGTALQSVDASGTVRQLGVPVPAQPVATLTDNPVLYLDDLAGMVREKLEACVTMTEPAPRFSGSTIYGGPYAAHSLLFPDHATVTGAGLTGKHWNLYAVISAARVAALNLDLAAVNATASGGNYLIGLTCLPYTFRQSGAPLSTALPLLLNPRTAARALDNDQVTAVRSAFESAFDPGNYASRQRAELDALASEFYTLLNTYTPKALTTVPTTPAKPTVPEYEEYADASTDYITRLRRAAAWVTYDAAVVAAKVAADAYNNSEAAKAADQAAVSARVVAIQQRCADLTHEVEAMGRSLWNEIAMETAWSQQRLYDLGGLDKLPNVDAPRVSETRFYLVTFVAKFDAFEEESAPSLPSNMLEYDQYDAAAVARPTVPAGRGVTHWRIYRSNAGSQSAAFQFAQELAVAVSSFTDTVDAAALGEVIPTIGWAEPEAGLIGLSGLPNGIMAAFKGNAVSFCEPYVPYAWPASYVVTTESPIVGMAAFGQTLFVGTEGAPYFISGSDSASMSAQKLDSNQACVSRRSIAAVQGGVLYASPDGLCVADTAGVRVISTGLYSREEWQALVPSSMFAVEHESIYYLFYNTGTVRGCITFDLAAKKLGAVNSLTSATAAYVDRVADALYVVDGTAIKQVHGASTRLTGVWKSPLVVFPSQSGLAWLKVLGLQSSDAPAVLKWYADGALKHTVSVTSIDPVRLPGGRYLEHEIQIESKARITAVMLAGNTQELQSV